MKISKKLAVTILVCSGMLLGAGIDNQIVKAADDIQDTTETTDRKIILDSTKNEIKVPIYEVTSSNLTDRSHPLGNGYITMSAIRPENGLDINNYGENKVDGVPLGDRYSMVDGEKRGEFFNYDGEKNILYDRLSRIQYSVLYYQIVEFDGTFHFFYNDKEIKTTSEYNDQRVAVDGNENISIPKVPTGYDISPNDEVKYAIGKREYNINVVKRQPLQYKITRSIKGTLGETLHDSYDESVPVGDSLDNVINLTNNSNYKPEIDFSTPIEVTVTPTDKDMEPLHAEFTTLDEFESFFPILNDDELVRTNYKGATISMDINYKDYDDETNPIKYDVVIPTLIDGKEADQTVKDVEGKLGEELDVKVPAKDGYKADKSTVKATVNADGTITTAEKVNYTKISTGGGSTGNTGNSSNNNNNNNETETNISNVDLNLGTTDNAVIYNNNGDSTTDRVAPLTSFKATQKMTKDGTVFYKIDDNQWLKADDVYHYEDFNGYLRTYNNSNKSLINTQDGRIKNRALAKATDWFSDRTAIFNGAKYYRVATNEWVNNLDVFEYQPEAMIITTKKDTVLYNENGKPVRVMNLPMDLRSDRIANIKGQQMYRVATNEYVLLTAAKVR